MDNEPMTTPTPPPPAAEPITTPMPPPAPPGDQLDKTVEKAA